MEDHGKPKAVEHVDTQNVETQIIKTPEPALATALDPALRADTTSEQDRHSLGQRRINLIWEHTQAAIALGLLGVTILEVAINKEIPADLVKMDFAVLGFYFGRTNHQRVGGVDLGR